MQHQISSTLAGYSITPVAFNSGSGTQGSEMTVSNPDSDKVYTCKVHYNGDEVTSKTVRLDVYGLLKFIC